MQPLISTIQWGMDCSKNPKSGPNPDRLKLDADWEDAMGDALSKPLPDEGVPDQPGKGTRPRKDKGSGKKPEPKDD